MRNKLNFLENSEGWILIQEIIDKFRECWNNSRGQDLRLSLTPDEREFMLEEWAEILKKVEARKDDLEGTDLSYSKLMKAQLQGAKLNGADLSFAYLMQADLSGADLSGVDFNSAVLSEANLNGANLEDADFTDAYLCGVDLSQVLNLTCDQLELANLDRDTRLPDYIQITWLSDTNFECTE